jgi:hypothetical protein
MCRLYINSKFNLKLGLKQIFSLKTTNSQYAIFLKIFKFKKFDLWSFFKSVTKIETREKQCTILSEMHKSSVIYVRGTWSPTSRGWPAAGGWPWKGTGCVASPSIYLHLSSLAVVQASYSDQTVAQLEPKWLLSATEPPHPRVKRQTHYEGRPSQSFRGYLLWVLVAPTLKPHAIQTLQ